MKKISRWIWAAAAVIALGLAACGSDEPSPNPPQPEQPDKPEQPDNPAKDWKGEKPHGFLFDVANLTMPVSERGFLKHTVRNTETGKYEEVDEIVMDESAFKSGQKMMTSGQPIASFNLTCEGVLADPFENEERYRTTCVELGFRPKSQFSEFEELMVLPAPEMGRVFLMDEVTSIALTTEKSFDADHPAGSSMAIVGEDGSGIGIWVMPGKPHFDMWKNGKSLDGVSGSGYLLGIGKCDKRWSTYPSAEMEMYIFGYPLQAGEYPMTLRMTFANAGTKVIRFTVKYVDKK